MTSVREERGETKGVKGIRETEILLYISHFTLQTSDFSESESEEYPPPAPFYMYIHMYKGSQA